MVTWNNELYHYGMPRRSGRYKWGSGKDPYHHGADAAFRKAKADYKANKKAINKEHRKSLRNVKDYRKVDSMVKNYKDARRTNKEAYAQAKKAYKQTAEYRRSRKRKIIAGALGVTAAATAAYLYANPRVVDDMKKYVSRVGKDKPVGSVPISNKVTVGDKKFVKPVANLTYTGRNTKAQKDARYYRMKKVTPRYSSKGMNIPRYSRPTETRNYTPVNRELAYGSSARYVPLYSKTGRNIRRLKPSSYRTDRNSDSNSGRAAYRSTFTTAQSGNSKTGKYRAMTTYYRDIEANREELDKRWRRSHSAGKNTYTNINRRYKRQQRRWI